MLFKNIPVLTFHVTTTYLRYLSKLKNDLILRPGERSEKLYNNQKLGGLMHFTTFIQCQNIFQNDPIVAQWG